MVGVTDVVVNEHVVHVPGAPLRQHLALCTGYRQSGGEPAVHRGLPSPYLTIIFTLDEPLVMAAHPDPVQQPGTFDVLIGGLHSVPAMIAHDGSQSGIQLGLSPLGARAMLGMPASELAGIDVHGVEVLGDSARITQEQLRDLSTWRERFELLERLLLDRLRAADEAAGVSPEIAYAWDELLRSDGSMSVADLAERTGWSDRHLRDRFRAETGLGPKEAARVIRFDRARRRLQQRAATRQPLGLADLAASAGYFDQAHLDRDFGQLAGCAPTTWVASEFRNFQARPAEALSE